ncbi:MAG: SCO family protein [Planctomycetes bacterium]|nr:SCO family protein [Planctomycetota bacterium]
MSRGVIVWLATLLILAGAGTVWTAVRLAQRNRDLPVETLAVADAPPGSDQPLLKEFTLTERTDRAMGSRDLLGHVWIGSFFFASCPGSCRTQNLELMALQNEFAKKGVKIVSITCDPTTDTTAKLREYAESFSAVPDAWYFLTGDLAYIRRVGTEFFRVWVDERGHMDRFLAVDKWGNVRGHFDWHDKARLKDLGAMLDLLLAETEPPADVTPVMKTAQHSGESIGSEDASRDAQETR